VRILKKIILSLPCSSTLLLFNAYTPINNSVITNNSINFSITQRTLFDTNDGKGRKQKNVNLDFKSDTKEIWISDNFVGDIPFKNIVKNITKNYTPDSNIWSYVVNIVNISTNINTIYDGKESWNNDFINNMYISPHSIVFGENETSINTKKYTVLNSNQLISNIKSDIYFASDNTNLSIYKFSNFQSICNVGFLQRCPYEDIITCGDVSVGYIYSGTTAAYWAYRYLTDITGSIKYNGFNLEDMWMTQMTTNNTLTLKLSDYFKYVNRDFLNNICSKTDFSVFYETNSLDNTSKKINIKKDIKINSIDDVFEIYYNGEINIKKIVMNGYNDDEFYITPYTNYFS